MRCPHSNMHEYIHLFHQLAPCHWQHAHILSACLCALQSGLQLDNFKQSNQVHPGLDIDIQDALMHWTHPSRAARARSEGHFKLLLPSRPHPIHRDAGGVVAYCLFFPLVFPKVAPVCFFTNNLYEGTAFLIETEKDLWRQLTLYNVVGQSEGYNCFD